MSPFTILILFAFALGTFGFIDEETELNFDELSSSEDLTGRIEESEGKIVGGKDAVAGQFPHQVSLRGLLGHFCGGSILNRRFVLTAAHCPQGYNALAVRIRVVVGSLRRNEGTIYRAASVHNHPEYSSARLTNDVSIIRTIDDILFDTPLVRPVRMPIFNVPEAGNFPVYVSGWGQTSHPGQAADTLQFKDALTFNRQSCITRLGVNGRFVHENVLCVQNIVGRGTCMGDSGGALISQRGVQVGICSWVVPCARGAPDGYANVFSHIQWIKATIKENWNSTQFE